MPFNLAVLSIFPELATSFFEFGVLGRAITNKTVEAVAVDLRSFASPPHFRLDEPPFGGGAGMVMTPGPILAAIEHTKSVMPAGSRVIAMSPAGIQITQRKVHTLAQLPGLILVCGRYEGIDQRALDLGVDEEISIGDFILMGGEVAAMAVIEATVRLIPGVLGNEESAVNESYSQQSGGYLLEAPQYTRPREFRGVKVPDVLLSGNHAEIAAWRSEQGRQRTVERRPDLIEMEEKQ